MLSLFYFSVVLILWPYCFYPLVLIIFRLGFSKKIPVIEPGIAYELQLFVCYRTKEELYDTGLFNRVLLALQDMSELQVHLIGDGLQWTENSPHPRLKFYGFPALGKNLGILEALKQTEIKENTVLGFSDANTIWEANQLRQMLRWLVCRPEIGLAGARLEYTEQNHQEARHQNRENWFREAESAIGALAGVSGGLMLIRSHLMVAVPADWPLDLALPLSLGISGVRSGFASEIVVTESLSGIVGSRRRQRTISRGLSCSFSLLKRLLMSNWLLAFTLVSRKILRFVWILTLPFFCFLFVWHFLGQEISLWWILVLPLALWPILSPRHLSDSCLGLIGAWGSWFRHKSDTTWTSGH